MLLFALFLAQAGYIDPALCSGCHAEIARNYRRTGMAKSFYRPTAANTVEDYERNNVFYHKASQRYYKMYRKDGRFYQLRYQIGIDGRQTNLLEKEIHFVMGSGNHARTYLNRTTEGSLLQLPVGWYAENGGSWAMSPGYDRPDHQDFRRRITTECMFCHNAYPKVETNNASAIFRGKIPEGIDCQRCHGPGDAHLRAAQNQKPTAAMVRASIVNPGSLSRERQMDVCMQCHLESTTFPLPFALRRFDRDPFSYRPGEPLGDFMIHFDKPPGRETFEINHTAYRLRQSSCFRSSNALTCTTCHDPHHALRGEEAAHHYTEVCRSCHKALEKLVTAGTHTAAADCQPCHMPKRRTDDVVHAVMTDHLIQRRQPALDLTATRGEPQEEKMGHRGEVIAYYPQPGDELYLAVAQVKQLANLQEGIPRLASAIGKLQPAQPEFYFELAEAYRANGQLHEAIGMYREALDRKAGYWAALRGLGLVLERSGQPVEALELARDGPQDAVSWADAGLIYIKLGRLHEAIDLLKKAVAADPDRPEAFNSLAAALDQSGEKIEAEAAYREAIRIQPDLTQAHSNLANLLAAKGNVGEAVFHYEQAIQQDPKDAAARYNYGSFLARRGEIAKAVIHLRQAAAGPNPAVRQAAQQLLDAMERRRPSP